MVGEVPAHVLLLALTPFSYALGRRTHIDYYIYLEIIIGESSKSSSSSPLTRHLDGIDPNRQRVEVCIHGRRLQHEAPPVTVAGHDQLIVRVPVRAESDTHSLVGVDLPSVQQRELMPCVLLIKVGAS